MQCCTAYTLRVLVGLDHWHIDTIAAVNGAYASIATQAMRMEHIHHTTAGRGPHKLILPHTCDNKKTGITRKKQRRNELLLGQSLALGFFGRRLQIVLPGGDIRRRV